MIRMHSVASCHDCAWEEDGPDADRLAHVHTTSKARGHIQHATTSRTHPTTRCAQEGCHDSR